MRFSYLFLGLALGGFAIGGSVLGCGGDGGGGGGAGGSGGSSASSTGSSSGPACAPKASCIAVDKDCLGLVDNSAGDKAGLRMSQLDLTKPAALTKGIVKNVVGGAVVPNITGCNVTGSATFNWLLQFDKATNKLKTGGAKPIMDPTKGYTFVSETINGFALAPVEVDVTVGADGTFSMAAGEDLLVPIFLDAGATQAVILPLKKARLFNGKLSDDRNCIGKYNAEGLKPEDSCLATETIPAFITDAELDGFITLEDADGVEITALGQTLCVLLSGDPTKYGDGGSPMAKCKRTNNVIDFKGDWCGTTNMAADAACADSVSLGAKFAASSVKIN